MSKISLFFLFLATQIISQLVTVPPTQSPTTNIQAGTLIISNNNPASTTSLVDDGDTISYNYPTAFTTVPMTGTAIIHYQCAQNFSPMDIQAKVDSTSTTSFVLSLKKNINVYKYKIRYFSVNSSFPYHFNIVPHFQVYQSVTITTVTTATVTTTYSTILPTSAAYKTFANPASNYNIIMYATCIQYRGTAQPTSPPSYYPPGLNLSYSIPSNTTFSVTLKIQTNVYIDKVHLTMIFYDKVQIQNSGQYKLYFDRVAWPVTGGTLRVDQPFWNSVIFGWTDFVGTRNSQILFFQLQLTMIDATNYGVKMLTSAPLGGGQPITTFGHSLFYMSTIICPNSSYYYNATAYLCILCSQNIPNCDTCLNQTNCTACVSTHLLNPTTKQCVPCPITGCKICSSFTTCQICDYTANYWANGSTTSCTLCSAANNSFINMSAPNYPCVLCNLNQCTLCQSLTVCLVCNTTNQYFLNITNLCQPCSIPNCLTCQSLTVCTVCDTVNGYYLDQLTNLQTCTNNCQASCACGGYHLPWDSINLQCSYCGDGILIGAQQCDDGNTVSSDGCSSTCIIQSTYICYGQPSTCIINPCTNNSYFYDVNAGGICTLCSQPMTNCLTCSNSTYCTLCQPSYWFDSINIQCTLCSIPGCSTCINATHCQQCDYLNNYWNNGSPTSCTLCDSIVNMFINMTDPNYGCVACHINQCVTCTNLSICSACNQTNNYYIDPSNQQCQVCPVFECLWCKNITHCTTCNQTNRFFLNTITQLCQLCTLTQCLTCSSLTVCLLCNNSANYYFDYLTNLTTCGPCSSSCSCDGYVVPWDPVNQLCSSFCGDGLIRINQQCDDGNIVSGDGCSVNCTIQIAYSCVSQPSNCTHNPYVETQLVSIEKDNCNSFIIKIGIPIYTLSQLKTNIRILNDGVNIVHLDQQINTNIFIIYAEYTKSIVNQTIQLQILSNTLVKIQYNPIAPPIYYTAEQCESIKQIQKKMNVLVTAFQVSSYSLLLFSLLSCKIVGLQLFGVLQLAYFSLSQHSYLNVYLQPLIKFKIFNGLNINLIPQSTILPNSLSTMKIGTNFINNCNIMLFILIAQLLIAIIIYFLSKILSSQKIQKVGMVLLKQGFITLILFNCFNIAFSAGVHLKYTDHWDPNYILSTIVLLITLCLFVFAVTFLEFSSQTSYGEYKSKFKKDFACKFYISLTTIYRIVLGFYCAIENQYNYSTLFVLGISFAFVLYLLINLPFRQPIHNYRAFLIHFTTLMIILVANYYRTMKSNTAMEIKVFIYAPAIIQLVLIALCLLLSLGVLVYEIYQMIYNCCNKNNKRKVTQEKSQQNQRKFTEESFATFK